MAQKKVTTLSWGDKMLHAVAIRRACGDTWREIGDSYGVSWNAVRCAAIRHRVVKMVVSPTDCPRDLKEKVLERALRHFEGHEITHRVVSKGEGNITFRFNRLSTKYPVGAGYDMRVDRV